MFSTLKLPGSSLVWWRKLRTPSRRRVLNFRNLTCSVHLVCTEILKLPQSVTIRRSGDHLWALVGEGRRWLYFVFLRAELCPLPSRQYGHWSIFHFISISGLPHCQNAVQMPSIINLGRRKCYYYHSLHPSFRALSQAFFLPSHFKFNAQIQYRTKYQGCSRMQLLHSRIRL